MTGKHAFEDRRDNSIENSTCSVSDSGATRMHRSGGQSRARRLEEANLESMHALKEIGRLTYSYPVELEALHHPA